MHVRGAVETGDTFVLVVSQDSSPHADDWEAAVAALDRRGIDVVAVAVPPPVIQNLAGRPILEYVGPSANEHLAKRVELGAAINFDRLSREQFEALVAEIIPPATPHPAAHAGRRRAPRCVFPNRQRDPASNWGAPACRSWCTHDPHGVQKNTVRRHRAGGSGRNQRPPAERMGTPGHHMLQQEANGVGVQTPEHDLQRRQETHPLRHRSESQRNARHQRQR